MAAPNQMIVADGGEYYNKGFRCLWIKMDDGTTYKFIVCDPGTAVERKIDLPMALTIASPLSAPEEEL